MRFQDPLDTILDHGTKVQILRFLCRRGGEWNGRRMAKELSLNPATTHRLLKELRQATLLDLKKIGNNLIYSLRDDHYLVREMLKPLFTREAAAVGRLKGLILDQLKADLRGQVLSIALYGSVATGQARPGSDIDLLVLVKSDKVKERVREGLERSWRPIAKRFGNPVSFYVETLQRLQEKRRQGVPLIKNMTAQHRPLWGRPLTELLHERAA
jgi:DNA-binding transcriptional ArsR family regulator